MRSQKETEKQHAMKGTRPKRIAPSDGRLTRAPLASRGGLYQKGDRFPPTHFTGGALRPREVRSSGPLSLRVGLECSWPELRLSAKALARSKTRPDHGGERRRADWPSQRRRTLQESLRPQFRPRRERNPFPKLILGYRLAEHPKPCANRSRGTFVRPCTPANRRSQSRPESAPGRQIR